KDMIINSAKIAYEHGLPGGAFAVFTVYASVFITALYSFRLIFMTFHGKERFSNDNHHVDKPKESPWVITLPLVLMAIPSAIVGWVGLEPFVSGEILDRAVFNARWITQAFGEEIALPLHMIMDSFTEPPVYFALAGIIIAWIFHRVGGLSAGFVKLIKPIYVVLERKYFMDDLYLNFFAPIARSIGRFLWTIGDMVLIDGLLVNGSAKVIDGCSRILRKTQSGYVNSYATFMVLGIIILLTFCTSLIFS
ncbi:MAG: NADH-quinone oxidoreductase subunit L, partial [Burkholderiales bacterium]|nr:NADH-quinone oxidoreductase subunit L [Burkholderiales bacterium]